MSAQWRIVRTEEGGTNFCQVEFCSFFFSNLVVIPKPFCRSKFFFAKMQRQIRRAHAF